jgi:hypothetical protein
VYVSTACSSAEPSPAATRHSHLSQLAGWMRIRQQLHPRSPARRGGYSPSLSRLTESSRSSDPYSRPLSRVSGQTALWLAPSLIDVPLQRYLFVPENLVESHKHPASQEVVQNRTNEARLTASFLSCPRSSRSSTATSSICSIISPSSHHRHSHLLPQHSHLQPRIRRGSWRCSRERGRGFVCSWGKPRGRPGLRGLRAGGL